MVNILELDVKPWFGAIVIREETLGEFRVMTQLRNVTWPPYDSPNHNCWEPVAGLLSKPGEDIITALLREFEEECGMPPGWKPLRILGVSDEDLHDDNRRILALNTEEDYLLASEIFVEGTPPDGKVWENGRGDHTHRYRPPRIPLSGPNGCKPLCVVENKGEPQHWIGPVFVVVVPPAWEPDYENADGEAGPCVWWPPYQLLRVMAERPDIFMGPFIPAYELACVKLLAGKLM